MKKISIFYNKIQKLWKYLKIFVTLSIWIAVAYFVYFEKDKFIQILNQPNLEWRWIIVSILLLSLNIGLEALKWFLMIKKFYPFISYGKAYQAILTGSASAFITPQKIGDYIGRLVYLTHENRIAGIFVTLLNRFAQLGATLVFATFASFFLKISFYPYIILFLTFAFHIILWFIPLIMAYFYPYIPKLKFIYDILIKIPVKLIMVTSLLSVIRFLVFLFQYLLIFKAFGISNENLWALCCLTFFIKSFIPSLAFSELGIREGVAIWVFGQYSNIDTVLVFQVTLILFVINTLIPATLGAWLIKNIKI